MVKKTSVLKLNFVVPIIFLLISTFLLKALFHSGLYTAHDIWHNYARLLYYTQGLKEGQLPPYFISYLANGFGYPLFIYSYHLPWLFAYPFISLGLSYEVVLKMLFFTGYFLSGITMYFFVYELTKSRNASLASGFLYLVAPYRFFIIFVSASLGISFSFIFVPLILWGIVNISRGYKNNFGILLVAVGLSGLILSHVATVFMFLPTILIFFLIFLYDESKNKGVFMYKVLIGILFSLTLSSFYLLPLLLSQRNIVGFDAIYKMGFVTVKQLLYSRWGYGVIINSALENPFSFQIGIVQWLVFIISIVYLIINYRNIIKNLPVFALGVMFIGNVFLMTSWSQVLWSSVIKYSGLDFPFRFICANVLISAVLLALLLIKVKKGFVQKGLIVAVVAIALFTNRNHLKVNMYLNEDTYKQFINSETTTNSYDEYLPKYGDRSLLAGNNRTDILRKSGLSIISENTISSKYRISKVVDGVIVFPKYYFPYLNVYIDDKEVKKEKTENGLISAKVNGSSDIAEIRFQKDLVMKIAGLTSILGLALLIGIYYLEYLKSINK